MAQIRTAVRPAWRILAILLGISILSWFVFFLVMISLGIYGNAPWYGALIGFLFPIWCMLYIIRMGRLTRIPLWITTIFLFIAIPHFLLGFWSPVVKDSVDRRVGTAKQTLANFLDKGSLKSETESGIFAKITTKTSSYNGEYKALHQFQVGDMVMVLDTKALPADKNGEGAVHVMWANPDGDFVAGNTGYIPTRTLDWNWDKPKSSPSSAPTATTTASSSPKVVYVTLPATTQTPVVAPPMTPTFPLAMKYTEKNGTVRYFTVKEITRTTQALEIVCTNGTIFSGKAIGNMYYGTWSRPGMSGGGFKELSFANNNHGAGTIQVTDGWDSLEIYPL